MTAAAASAPSTLTPVPAEAVARLIRNLETCIATIHTGLESGEADPAQLPRWRRAAALLERDLEQVRAAGKQAMSGDQQALVEHASRLRFLARRMDGYRLDFAGAELGEKIETQRRLTVLVAWQIFATATGSKATGL